MSNVLSQAVDWIKTRPYWEQAAFKAVLKGKELCSDDYDELIDFCLEDAKLESSSVPRPQILWSDDHTLPVSTECVKILELSNLRNINALAHDQTLTFHPNLTVIYGANGSGKSGYSRMLAHAGFSRGDSTIRPNVMKPEGETENISFDLIFSVGDDQQTVTFNPAEQSTKLYSLYVFDSLSIVRHLTKSEKISFSPAGLMYFSRLGDVVTNCIQRLESKTKKYFEPHGFENLFTESSEVKTAVSDNNFVRLKALLKVSDSDANRYEELGSEISRLKNESVVDKINRLNLVTSDIKTLNSQLQNVEILLTADVEEINENINLYGQLQANIEKEGIGQFDSGELLNIGGSGWIELIKAARQFAKTQQTNYPNTDDECLLCQQKLTVESRQLLHSLWNFLEVNHQSELENIKGQLEAKIKKFEDITFDFFNEQSATYRYLQQDHPEIVPEIEDFIESCNMLKSQFLTHLSKFQLISTEANLNSPISALNNITENLSTKLSVLERQDSAEELYKLEDEHKELHHRFLLKEKWEQVSKYFTDIQWANKAKKAVGTTRHITQKHNELFQLLVTDRYVELFKNTLEELKCPLNVKVSTKGRHAEVFKQIILESPSDSIKLEGVLSEGEKRAVAIADFITEATLDDNCSIIVLDDPVTSLDQEWKETMAHRLVTESLKRQVIIFTHDRTFLSLIKRFSEEQNIEVSSHSIERKFDNSPGFVHLNYSPDLVNDYRTVGKAVELLMRARNSKAPDERKFILQQGFNALRTTYEAFIIFKLFAGVVRRFDPHIRVNSLNQIQTNPVVLNRVIEKFNYISRFTGGHLPSDLLELEEVSIEKLESEIQEFKEIEKSLKDLKKK